MSDNDNYNILFLRCESKVICARYYKQMQIVGYLIKLRLLKYTDKTDKYKKFIEIFLIFAFTITIIII